MGDDFGLETKDCIIAADGDHVVCSGHDYDECGIIGNRDDARLIAAAPELLDALKRVLTGFEVNAFQRNTDGDTESGWAIKFMPHLMALADATRAIEKAEGR